MERSPLEKNDLGRNGIPSRPGSAVAPLRVKWRSGELHSTLGSSWSRTWLRTLCLGCSAVVLFYSVMVLMHVAWMGTIGVRCMFGTEVEEEVPADFVWKPLQPERGEAERRRGSTATPSPRPQVGDRLTLIGSTTLREGQYSDYIQAMRGLNHRVGQAVEVEWEDPNTEEIRAAEAIVRYPPTRSYVWSCLWFLQELLIFAVGARVFWKRPGDDSARLFFVLCIVTVGAYMGGYHWTEIVVRPALIYPFAFFALPVPVVNLHFFLVFPRQNPVLLAHRRLVLAVLYGAPGGLPGGHLGRACIASHWLQLHDGGPVTAAAERVIRALALGYIALAVLFFALCIPCLVFSYRRADSRAEKNQVKWILLASLLASVLIGYLLWQAWIDAATLGRDSAAWPMVGVSLLYTIAYAFSITRYKLMQVEEIINRSVVYFAFSVTAGLIYSGVLLASGWLIGDRLLSTNPTSWGAMVAALSVIVVLILSEVARGRFQRVIDRQFFREKYKFDQAMQKMRLAVGSLVDRITLGRRLLEGAVEVLRVEWGCSTCSSRRKGVPPGGLPRPEPDEQAPGHGQPAGGPAPADAGRPPVARPGAGHVVRPRHRRHDRPGGEAASAVGGNGQLAGLLILGPKRSGMPFEDEEMAFLGALSSVATLALHSAGHPADAREPEPGAARQGRQDRRAAAADPDPPGAAPRPGRARPRRVGPCRGRALGIVATRTRTTTRSRPSSTRSRVRARLSGG